MEPPQPNHAPPGPLPGDSITLATLYPLDHPSPATSGTLSVQESEGFQRVFKPQRLFWVGETVESPLESFGGSGIYCPLLPCSWGASRLALLHCGCKVKGRAGEAKRQSGREDQRAYWRLGATSAPRGRRIALNRSPGSKMPTPVCQQDLVPMVALFSPSLSPRDIYDTSSPTDDAG